MDAISEFPSPPARLPKYIREYFSYGGLAELVYDYQDDKNGTGRFIHWYIGVRKSWKCAKGSLTRKYCEAPMASTLLPN